MPSTYKILYDKDYADSFREADAFALDVLVGLSSPRKKIPSKYFYDEKGMVASSFDTFCYSIVIIHWVFDVKDYTVSLA